MYSAHRDSIRFQPSDRRSVHRQDGGRGGAIRTGGSVATGGSVRTGGLMRMGGVRKASKNHINAARLYHSLLSMPQHQWEGHREIANQASGGTPHPFWGSMRHPFNGETKHLSTLARVHSPHVAAKLLESHHATHGGGLGGTGGGFMDILRQLFNAGKRFFSRSGEEALDKAKGAAQGYADQALDAAHGFRDQAIGEAQRLREQGQDALMDYGRDKLQELVGEGQSFDGFMNAVFQPGQRPWQREPGGQEWQVEGQGGFPDYGDEGQ